jgi:RNA polymerase sigma factor FliA
MPVCTQESLEAAPPASRASGPGAAARRERENLVEGHLPFVRRVAARMMPQARPYLELDDLIAIGVEALLHAFARYDESRGVPFGTFAYLRVRGAMWEGIGAVGPFSRGLVRRRRGRPEPHGPRTFLRLDERHADGGGARRAVEEQMAGAIDAARFGPHLAAALDSLDERERQLVLRHYFDGQTLHEIGLAMGHTRSWASRVHASALVRLRATLERAPSAGAREPKPGGTRWPAPRPRWAAKRGALTPAWSGRRSDGPRDAAA